MIPCGSIADLIAATMSQHGSPRPHQPVHRLNADPVRHKALAFAGFEQLATARLRPLDCNTVLAVEQQRHRAVKAPVRQAGQGDQRLDGMPGADGADHRDISSDGLGGHRNQRRIPDQPAAVGGGVQRAARWRRDTPPASKPAAAPPRSARRRQSASRRQGHARAARAVRGAAPEPGCTSARWRRRFQASQNAGCGPRVSEFCARRAPPP